MKTFLAVSLLLLSLLACQNTFAPSLDCQTEKLRVLLIRGQPDSIAIDMTQLPDHLPWSYERWYYHGSQYVETFTYGPQVGRCIYDQENRPDWLLPSH